MKGAIFGFQYRVWWPKCTPASSISRMDAAIENDSPVKVEPPSAPPLHGLERMPLKPASACILALRRDLNGYGCVNFSPASAAWFIEPHCPDPMNSGTVNGSANPKLYQARPNTLKTWFLGRPGCA